MQGHKGKYENNKECRRKVQKQQSTAHNSKNDSWTIAQYDKSHQNIAGTQGNSEKTKNAEWKLQKQQSTAHNCKNDTWTIAEYDKSHQNICRDTR